MRLSRLFVDSPLTVEQEIVLPQESTHYLLNVLRLRVGAPITVFNGQGGEYAARLIAAAKKAAQLQVIEYKAIERESALPLGLVQAISRPEHFNDTIQKAVELGVQRIVPVLTERSPPLDKSKISKREQQWRKIIISACEQCGRNRLPELYEVLPLSAWLAEPQQSNSTRNVLQTHNSQSTTHNPQSTIHNSQLIHNSQSTTHNSELIHNSEFTIHNSQLELVLSPSGKSRLPEAVKQKSAVTVLTGAEGGL
ncbi:MAG TPA: 16S rRNA (uracil(1498)-N(3))-methyltransferase, partial [Thioploca sp.]|nr:16S rRNA (uracil(1498)-N(3))-methyltransferase [Thioploca sp.]